MGGKCRARRIVLSLIALIALTTSCGDDGEGPPRIAGPLDPARAALSGGRWQEALAHCTAPTSPPAPPCEARYCELLARSMLFVDELNNFLLPQYRTAELSVPPGDLERYAEILRAMDALIVVADEVVAGGCSFDLDHLPVRLGDLEDPVVLADARGRWTTRSALFIASVIDSVRYIFLATIGAAPVPPPPPGSNVPGLPALLERLQAALRRQDELLAAVPANPDLPQGGWRDRDGDGRLSRADELLIDLFVPGSDERVFDFSGAEMAIADALPLGRILEPEDLPPAACGYQRWRIETIFEGPEVGTTDGMDFSPDGREIVLPIRVGRDYQIHRVDLATGAKTCLTCDGGRGWNDGVRWQPHGDALIFVSGRDHPYAIGGAGGGFGQELYAMRPDGSQVTRLTESPNWATNYHVNWSHDGRMVVWGNTTGRTWDVMVADFIDDQSGMRLENVRRLTRDTSWWETHGFTPNNEAVIVTNTRAGWQSSDLYAIRIADGAITRLTDDLAWDEHAHLSPDGRKLSWISARWRPASMLRLTDGSISPVFDFFWIVPAILFEFANPPAGFSAELTLMDADGSNLQRLTFEDQVVADNVWSPDARRILFRQTPTAPRGPSRIRILTFEDCG